MKHTTVYNIHFISCLYGNTMDCTAASSLAENCSWFFIDSTLLLSEHPLDSESNLLMCALLHVCVRPSIIFGGAGGKPPKMWNSSTYRLILSHCICPLMLKMCIIVLYYLNTLLRKYYCFEFFLKKQKRKENIYPLLLYNEKSSAIVGTGICNGLHRLTQMCSWLWVRGENCRVWTLLTGAKWNKVLSTWATKSTEFKRFNCVASYILCGFWKDRKDRHTCII